MDDCFNFESTHNPHESKVRMIAFRTSDDTEWTLTEEWIDSKKKPKTRVQRLIFTKENHYDRDYRIGIEVTSVSHRTSGRLEIAATTRRVKTKIVILLDQYKVFRYRTRGMMDLEDDRIETRYKRDIFRFRVTLQRSPAPASSSSKPEACSPKLEACLPEPAASLPEASSPESVPATGDKLLVFSQQIHSLLETGVLSDFALVAGETLVPVHRSVLSARSSFFCAMFRYDTQESQDGVACLPEEEAWILPELLRYLYSGVLRPIDVDMAEDLFIVADKYGILGLKSACAEVLLNHASLENLETLKKLSNLIPSDECMNWNKCWWRIFKKLKRVLSIYRSRFSPVVPIEIEQLMEQLTGQIELELEDF